MKTCGFCNEEMSLLNKTYQTLFDIYTCIDCQKSKFKTLYKETYYAGDNERLLTQIRVDEYYVIQNYKFNYTSKRQNYTTIYVRFLGLISPYSVDSEPIAWTPAEPALILDGIIDLPMDNPLAIKEKLQTYILFS